MGVRAATKCKRRRVKRLMSGLNGAIANGADVMTACDPGGQRRHLVQPRDQAREVHDGQMREHVSLRHDHLPLMRMAAA